ncbi:MAG: calcium-binding protein [Aliishimia sp.]
MQILDRPALGLDALATFTAEDPGLAANIHQQDIDGGVAAARVMNDVVITALNSTGVNADTKIDASDMRTLSAFIRSDSNLYDTFLSGHGNDEGDLETGYHLVQGDGGAYRFQGRDFIDTVADAVYHIGFAIVDGRFQNEDGDQNETVEDVAGWLNYFLNGENIVYGTSGEDRLGSGHYSFALDAAVHEVFEAGAGNDRVNAGLGNDVVFAGTGDDRANGNEGDDHLKGEAGDDKLWGNEGNDLIEGGVGADVLAGGEGMDELHGGDGNDTVYGGLGDDVLHGDSGADELAGEDGDDILIGGNGDDRLWGSEGDDGLRGQNGADRIGGGNGDDKAWGGAGADTISGNAGTDMLHGGAGADQIWGGGGYDDIYGGADDDHLAGEDGNDTLRGGTGADAIRGGAGNDIIYGQMGDDDLRGGNAHDILFGGDGNDELTGGNGRDYISGGEGADILNDWEDVDARDVFAFSLGHTGVTQGTRDLVRGFDSGLDRIDLTGFGDLTWQSGAGFSGNGIGQVRFEAELVRIDADGNGVVDAMIELENTNFVTWDDFIL